MKIDNEILLTGHIIKRTYYPKDSEAMFMDNTDYKILRAISDLKVPAPKIDRIQSRVDIDPEELGARLGVLEMEGYVRTQSDSGTQGASLHNGICAAGLTNQGHRALEGERWQ
jgi:hypothetical protein